MALIGKTSRTARPTSPLTAHKELFWLGRFCLLRTPSAPEGGFVLPIATLMLVMLTLVVGGILARTLSRTEQVAAQRNQTMLVNAASPGVERAKAKLQRMFESYGIGFIPSDDRLTQDLRGNNTLSGETRLDLNGDGKGDSAWSFESDINGDGTNEKIGYAIVTSAANGNIAVTSPDTTKASSLVVRYAPLDTSKNTNPLCPQPEYDLDNAWRPTSSSSTFRKTLQIVAWAKNPKTNETVTLGACRT
jgi:type II secretory pathway pseudopilin PulG